MAVPRADGESGGAGEGAGAGTDTSGAPLGLLVLTVPVTAFNQLVGPWTFYDRDEVIFLAGVHGTVAGLNGVYLPRQMPGAEAVGRIVSEGEGTAEFRTGAPWASASPGWGGRVGEGAGGAQKQTDKLFVFSACRRINFVAVYMVQKSAIYGSAAVIRGTVTVVTLACLLLTLVVSYLVTKSIAAPLARLSSAMEAVGSGSGLDLTYTDPQRDELGLLGAYFNSMLERLRSLVASLLEEERVNRAEQLKRREAQMFALQMQIDPHFMYNTLDLIRWNAMLVEDGEGKVSRMLAEFSSLLRFNRLNPYALVPLSEELSHAEAFMRVFGFKDDPRADLRVTGGGGECIAKLAAGYRLPKLTLQPLVENAVKHGLREDGRRLTIEVAIEPRANGDLEIRVRDDGAGIAPQKLAELRAELGAESGPCGPAEGKPPFAEPAADQSAAPAPDSHAAPAPPEPEAPTGGGIGSGIGLKNVHERLMIHFGPEYGLTLDSRANAFTEVRILIPRS
jgi:sensor histidine kinase YesM